MALKVDYVTRETLTNLRRNLLLSTASMLTIAVSLSLVGIAFLVRYGVDEATQRWKNGIEFEVFLNTGASPAQKTAIERRLTSSPDIDKVVFIDRDKQYDTFRSLFANNPVYLQTVKAKDLPESYRVKPAVHDAAVIRDIAARYQQQPGVWRVEFAGKQVERALRTSRAMQTGLLLIAVVLFVASALLIFNSIRMAIFARRREIEVMKLVGASNWFIRVPFMVEGLLQGLVGSAGAFAAASALRSPLSRWIVDNLDQFAGFHVPSSHVATIGLYVVVMGAAAGATSAGVAVTRFLDV